MTGMLDAVDQRTTLVGKNRLELLLFRLGGKQTYGINVFKVREVLQCPHLTLVPQRNPIVCGIAHIRGGTISVLDLDLAIGNVAIEDHKNSFIIISEYNNSIQGFLVSSVERIVNLNWEEIHPPPQGSGRDNYLTAVTQVGDRIIEILDVEKILLRIAPETGLECLEGMNVKDGENNSYSRPRRVLIADDSSVARKQIRRCLEKVGLEVIALNDGAQAFKHLRDIVEKDEDIDDHYALMISDVEMPNMDGYTLTSSIRNDPQLSKMFIVLHTSLSGVFNEAMVSKVGANEFLAKFRPEMLAQMVLNYVERDKESPIKSTTPKEGDD